MPVGSFSSNTKQLDIQGALPFCHSWLTLRCLHCSLWASKGSDLRLNPANPIWEEIHTPSPTSHQPLLPSPFPLFYYIYKPTCKGVKGSHKRNELLFPDSIYPGFQALLCARHLRRFRQFFLEQLAELICTLIFGAACSLCSTAYGSVRSAVAARR